MSFVRLQEMLSDAENCQEHRTLAVFLSNGRLPLEVSVSPNLRITLCQTPANLVTHLDKLWRDLLGLSVCNGNLGYMRPG